MTTPRQSVLRLARMRPKKVAEQTRQTVGAGGSVSWVWSKDRDFKRAAQALGDWQAPHGGSWRLGQGQSLAVFASEAEQSGAALTFWQR